MIIRCLKRKKYLFVLEERYSNLDLLELMNQKIERILSLIEKYERNETKKCSKSNDFLDKCILFIHTMKTLSLFRLFGILKKYSAIIVKLYFVKIR